VWESVAIIRLFGGDGQRPDGNGHRPDGTGDDLGAMDIDLMARARFGAWARADAWHELMPVKYKM